MNVYKSKIQSDGSLDKLVLIILVRGDFQNKEMVRDTFLPTASMRTLNYFLADAAKNKAGVHQLDFIGAFLQAKVKNRVFFKLYIIYTEMLEDICDGSQTHPNVNKREARYKIHDRVWQRQSEWKGALVWL